MSNNKQSSVEWLINELTNLGYIHAPSFGFKIIDDKIEQAKAMHKEEIENAQMDMFIHLNELPYSLQYLEKRQSAEDFANQYYNETFNQ